MTFSQGRLEVEVLEPGSYVFIQWGGVGAHEGLGLHWTAGRIAWNTRKRSGIWWW